MSFFVSTTPSPWALFEISSMGVQATLNSDKTSLKLTLGFFSHINAHNPLI